MVRFSHARHDSAKEQISIRLDRDVLDHFRQYPRYQTRINAILRAAIEHEKKAR
ncbi:MAG: BrnA antitoxin family protein [Alphaproteobacteria bacterium]|nr:BrnA antitoxin family protein [Alphaproteobacteria bacterium]